MNIHRAKADVSTPRIGDISVVTPPRSGDILITVVENHGVEVPSSPPRSGDILITVVENHGVPRSSGAHLHPEVAISGRDSATKW